MKYFYLFILISVLYFNGKAQTLYPRIGITGSTSTYREPNTDIQPKIGFTAGLGYNMPLSRKISVQSEINYVQRSFEYRYATTTMIQYGDDLYELHEKGSDRFTISYLELPLLLKAQLIPDKFFVLGGVAPGMGLGGTHKYTFESTSSYLDPVSESGSGKIKFGDSSLTTDEDVYFDNRWDVSLQIGIGALILKKIQVECRYSIGMVDLNDNVDSKSHSLQVSLSTPLELN